jgi:inner membrane protein
LDNVCHTLVGAAFARARIAKPVPLAAATAMLAANLPDVDVLVFASSVPSVAFRRGWTHGALAQAVLPAAFAVVMWLAARSRRPSMSAQADRPPLGPFLVLSYAGVISHVFLDYLNNYGVRLLMPFSGQWFYGDTLFIIDPWLWGLFGAAAFLSRKAGPGPGRAFLLIAAVYIAAMMVSASLARQRAIDAWRREHSSEPRAIMVGPVPVNPLRKHVIVDEGDRYRTGTLQWLPSAVNFADMTVRKNDGHAAVARARTDPSVAAILVWSRFPFWEIEPADGGLQVTVRDMRFASLRRGGFSATATVR